MRRARLACIVATAAAALLAGCAMPVGQVSIQKPPSSVLAPGLTPQAALAAIVPGRSTKAEVAAALGPATVVHFDSGYEVWVYRTRADERGGREPDELVVLFAPTGVAQKTRFRPGEPLRTGR
jgi:outer membrane protein assembly factor BamE (lipoprotein component of BamABCDE complex)